MCIRDSARAGLDHPSGAGAALHQFLGEDAARRDHGRRLKDKTVMVIAHRMRTVANADKIVVLDDGKVSEISFTN